MAHSPTDEFVHGQPPSRISRRQFLRGTGLAGVGAVMADHPLLGAAETSANEQSDENASVTPEIVLSINGQKRTVKVESRTTLLNVLRDHLSPPLTGPKLVCDAGTCGACTVLFDGKPIYSCMVLAVDAPGKEITTVEGLGSPDKLSAVQEAFVEKDALMCGFCTPGFVTTVAALLRTVPNPTEYQVREACKGNFCRCGTYPRVFEAALAAARAAR